MRKSRLRERSDYKDTNLINMLKGLCPGVEIKIVRQYKGRPTDPSKAIFLIDGRMCWTKIRELEDIRSKHGHPAVMKDLAHFLSSQITSPIKTGSYDSHRLSERMKRHQGKRAEMLEFAMKSAGSSDEEIYQELKDV